MERTSPFFPPPTRRGERNTAASNSPSPAFSGGNRGSTRPRYLENHSTTAPVLNVLDFSCFLNKFAAGDPYANCDGSTTPPVLNVLDFACFLNKFAAGCP